MAKQVLNKSTPSNRVDHVDQRNKINANFTELYDGKVDKEAGKSLVSTAEKANWNAKQDPLTLKTVNGESIVGTGNIVVSGGGGNVASVNGILPDGAKNVALTTDNIPQTTEKQYVSTTEKSNWNGASIGSNLGLLKTTDTPPPTGTHKGDVNSAGTYTNFKTAAAVSIVFTAPELVDNFGYIYVVDNVATKSLVAKKGGGNEITIGTASEIYNFANANPTVIFNAILSEGSSFKPIWHIGDKLFSDATGALIDLGITISELSITPLVNWNGELSKVVNITTVNPSNTWSLSGLPTGVTASALTGTGNSTINLNFNNQFYSANDIQLTLTSAGQTVNSTLRDSKEELVIKVKLTAENEEFRLPIAPLTVNNYTADFGDGTVQSFVNAAGIHNYVGAIGDEFTVKVTGNISGFAFTGFQAVSKNMLKGIYKNTMLKTVATLSLKDCEYLEYLCKGALSFFSGTSLSGALDSAGKLLSSSNGLVIDKDAFKGLTNVTNLYNLFKSSGIKVLETGTLSPMVNVTNIQSIFNGSKLKTVKSEPFKGMLAITNVNSAFINNSLLETVPNSIFSDQNLITNVSATFKLCPILVADALQIYTNLNKGTPTITSGCFNSSPLLTNLSSVPSGWK